MPGWGNGSYRENRIMAAFRGHDGMRPPKFRPNRSIGRRVIAFPTFSGGRPPSWIGILPFWTTHEVKHAVRLPCQNVVSIRSSPPEILRLYDFASLTAKMPNHAFFGGFEPLKIMGHLNPKKAHTWARTRHLSHKWLKSVQGCAWHFGIGLICKVVFMLFSILTK